MASRRHLAGRVNTSLIGNARPPSRTPGAGPTIHGGRGHASLRAYADAGMIGLHSGTP
jgi:hypothetical protein